MLKDKYMNGPYVYNGLDRVNNLLGYELTNVVPCCNICNRAKKDMTYEQFKLWIKDLKENN